ncbi:hypothetical protein E3P94_01605 [Wallemia ichthyophaga]|nr:hypothetical protein E3P98_01377 [Wallemia ichthyophaga]TIB00929.1 hypothetical protein E3P95_01473 [Wallemia ichthyophaga]TIB01877.1 hypothetical protein E3P94_01605 [Wallemia ichthyophaga]
MREDKKTVTATTAATATPTGYWYYVGLYLMFNLALTLFNKAVLDDLPYPYTLTAVHAASNVIGCTIARLYGLYTPAKLSTTEIVILIFFSTLYTINIAVSNLSLSLVTVPVHQIIRSLGPLFTMALAVPILGSKFSIPKLVSLLPVIAGIALTTYGEISFTALGLFLTFAGTILAAFKTVVTNLMQTGQRFQMHPLDLLHWLSPLALAQCIAYAVYTGEYFEVYKDLWPMHNVYKTILVIALNGALAFGLNVVSFVSNKKVGPLTISVAANIKQVLTVVLSFFFFELSVSQVGFVGIVLALLGGLWYGRVEYNDKKRALTL